MSKICNNHGPFSGAECEVCVEFRAEQAAKTKPTACLTVQDAVAQSVNSVIRFSDAEGRPRELSVDFSKASRVAEWKVLKAWPADEVADAYAAADAEATAKLAKLRLEQDECKSRLSVQGHLQMLKECVENGDTAEQVKKLPAGQRRVLLEEVLNTLTAALKLFNAAHEAAKEEEQDPTWYAQLHGEWSRGPQESWTAQLNRLPTQEEAEGYRRRGITCVVFGKADPQRCDTATLYIDLTRRDLTNRQIGLTRSILDWTRRTSRSLRITRYSTNALDLEGTTEGRLIVRALHEFPTIAALLRQGY